MRPLSTASVGFVAAAIVVAAMTSQTFGAPLAAIDRSAGDGERDSAERDRGKRREPVKLVALHYLTNVYAAARSPRRRVGYLRRGTRLDALVVDGPRRGCYRGKWYQLHSSGFVCSTRGVALFDVDNPATSYRAARVDRPLPYRYGKVKRRGAPPRFRRLPSPAELQRFAAGSKLRIVDKLMKGAFFVAIDREERSGDRRFLRTVGGRYVAAEDVELLAPSRMKGELLGSRGLKPPLAFLYGEQRHPVFLPDGEQLTKAGWVRRQQRFRVQRLAERGGDSYVVTSTGLLLRRSSVRLVTAIARPAGISKNERWIHVDVKQQTLVAYQGDHPVYATIVSGGKPGYEAPTGLFRIRDKRVTFTMKGPDHGVGWYEVEEVPWTMFYHGGFALHGAYWHDDFGTGRSHGCTNIAPADARWLFHWAAPDLPSGWHRRAGSGMRVYFTADEPS